MTFFKKMIDFSQWIRISWRKIKNRGRENPIFTSDRSCLDLKLQILSHNLYFRCPKCGKYGKITPPAENDNVPFTCRFCETKDKIPAKEFRDELFAALERSVYSIEKSIKQREICFLRALLLGRELYIFAREWHGVVNFIFASLFTENIGNTHMDMTVLNALGEDDNVIILAHPRILNVSKFFCANVTLLDIWKQTAVISPFLYIPFVFASFYWKDHMKYSTLHFASISPLRSDWKGFFPKWNENDIARAKSEFERMKIDPCIPHICFMARDNAYKAFGDATPQTMSVWEIRNTPVSLYYKSMEMLAEKGYTVFRMGSLTNEIVQLENERIIDYANLYRTEFMDLYLASTCRFFVSCGTGVDILPIVSGLPVVLVNAMYIAMLYENWNLNNIYLLPRKTYDPMEKRFISLCEMYTRGIANQRYTTKIQRIQNTPEEIWKIVREVEERLSGTWEETDEDIKLQERYRSIMRFYEGYQADFEVKYRIGADFLRENADWFLTMLYHLASFEEHQQFEKGISTGQLKIATYGMTETNIKFLPEGMLNVGNVAVNFDGNPEKWGEIDVLGLKIQPPEKIKEYMVNLDAMLIMSSQYFRISEILEKLGVEKYYIRVGFESNTDKRDYLPVLPEKFRIVMYDQKLYKPSPYLPPFTGNEWELSQIHMNSGAYVINGE